MRQWLIKGTGNKENIQIKNDSNRLSPEDVERMVKEAEKFAEEDAKVAARVTAKVNINLSNGVTSSRNWTWISFL